jgi:hypothetical protein
MCLRVRSHAEVVGFERAQESAQILMKKTLPWSSRLQRHQRIYFDSPSDAEVHDLRGCRSRRHQILLPN